MTLLFEILFWVSLGWLLYVFIVYPALIGLLAKLRPRPVRRSENYTPEVCFVMAAYNEEEVIGRRLQSYLDLEYPREKLSFSIGSDASADRTDEIVRDFQQKDPTISLQRFNRVGKTEIVYTLAGETESEIIIFCDADIELKQDVVKTIVSCFADEEVGGVVVRVVYRDKDKNTGNVGETTYLDMENGLRRNESLWHSTVSPTGQCFAVRNGYYSPLTDYGMSDDLNLAITIPLNGKRVWYEPTAVIEEINDRNLWSECKRRLRMGQQSMATFLRYEGTRWPWRSKTGFQIWSHKVLRNLAAVPALLLLISSLALFAEGGIYKVVGVLGLVWAGFSLVGLLLEVLRLKLPIIGYPLYFTLMIANLAVGSFRAIFSGKGLAMWNSPRIKHQLD
ncbi:MAG: glycosyltransferase [Candidatus Kapaibacterium sp.]